MAVPATLSVPLAYHKELLASYVDDDCPDDAPQRRNKLTGPKSLIGQALYRRVAAIDNDRCMPGDEDAFYVADLGEIYRQHLRWEKSLPRVRPFYAVKCNDDENVLRLLAKLGTGFDCASRTEIKQILAVGATAEDIIYANPCKTSSYLRFAKAARVERMVFDNADELNKIARYYPEAQLFLRIITNDSSSMNPLSMKFGAYMDETEGLLAVAKTLGLNVVGVSFHVGTGATNPAVFYEAIRDSNVVFERARKLGLSLRCLNIGGGFQTESFEPMADVANMALDRFFPEGSGVEIIAEPGRFYVSSAFTVACNVIGRRAVTLQKGTSYMLFVNDGMYGSFLSVVFGHKTPLLKVLYAGGQLLYDTPAGRPCVAPGGLEYSVWGPTCDGMDRILTGCRLNVELNVGDWVYFDNMGAYAKCTSSGFNGFPRTFDVLYVCSDARAQAILDS